MIIRVCRWCVNDLVCRSMDSSWTEYETAYVDGDCQYFNVVREGEHDRDAAKNGTDDGR